MDIALEKIRLIEQLAQIEDIDLLQKVKDVLNSTGQDQIAGYNTDGNEITELELIKRAHIANLSIKEGRTKSIDQVREEMKKW